MVPAIAQQPNDRPAFDAVYDAHVDYVWRTMRRLGVPDAHVDDAVQDTFVVVHRRLPDFEGRSAVKTWVFGIALRVARDVRRTLRRRGPQESLPEQLRDPGPGPEAAAERNEGLAILDRLLAELDDEKREVLVLAEIEELTAPEISAVLEVKLNTVYSRLRAARKAFDAAAHRHRTKEARLR